MPVYSLMFLHVGSKKKSVGVTCPFTEYFSCCILGVEVSEGKAGLGKVCECRNSWVALAWIDTGILQDLLIACPLKTFFLCL